MTRPVQPRSAWTSYAPRFTYMGPQRYWWLHHTAGGCSPNFHECLRATERYHIDARGMLAIAYLAAATNGGEVAEARGINTVGGHTLDWNSRSHAIVVPGDFTYDEPTDELVWAVADVVVWSIDEGKALPDPIFGGHRDAGTTPTACPGNKLYARIPDVRDAIASGGSGASPPPVIIPPEEADVFVFQIVDNVDDPKTTLDRVLVTSSGRTFKFQSDPQFSDFMTSQGAGRLAVPTVRITKDRYDRWIKGGTE